LRIAAFVPLVAVSFAACIIPTKDNPATCSTNAECASQVCNLATYYCEPVGVDSGLPDDRPADAILVFDSGDDVSAETNIPIDVPLDQQYVDAAVDTRVPDAAGTCGTNADCPDSMKAFCVAGICVGCQPGLDGGASMCTAPTSVCDTITGRCVGCTASRQCSSAAAPVCDTTKNVCAACTADLQCQTKNATLPACRSDGQCVQCTATTASTSCTGPTPVCNTTTNTCAQCTASANCTGTTPICGSAEKCQACATDPDCAGLNDPARGSCTSTGACVQCTAANASKCAGTTSVCNTTSNKCVECLTNATCSGAAPICAIATSTCRGCANVADCTGFAGRTACAASGACVQCTDNTTCSGMTPICATGANACRKCGSDAECSTVGPGVCLTDGHCATDAQTVYVGTVGAAICSETNAGTVQAPVCSVQAGVTLAKKNSAVVVLIRGALSPASANIAVASPLTIAGKSTAIISPTASPGADTLTITSGEIYLRNLTIQGSTSPATGMGVKAAPDPGSTVTLHIDTCAVVNHPGGGILLNGAAFDIKNTTVSNNGSGSLGAITWGGILTNNPPSGGPMSLASVTIKDNGQVGLVCSASIAATTTFLASGNNNGSIKPTDQVGTSCGITTCVPASTTCGAQSQPQ
jgi:hypothetical protein